MEKSENRHNSYDADAYTHYYERGGKESNTGRSYSDSYKKSHKQGDIGKGKHVF
jgi:hypothetical protein